MVTAPYALWLGTLMLGPSTVSVNADQVVLQNEVVRRVIRTSNVVGTTSFSRMDSREEFIRTIEPEARLIVDNTEYWLGGVQPLPNKAFLTETWIANAVPSPKSLPLRKVTQGQTQSRIPHRVNGAPWSPRGRACNFEFEHPDFFAVLTFEIYDGVPAIAKHVTVTPKPSKRIVVNQIVTERLSLVEAESEVERSQNMRLPNVTVLSDMSMGGNLNASTFWETDDTYTTQVNYLLKTPCLVEVRPPNGMHTTTTQAPVRSVTSFAILHGGSDRESNSLDQRRLYRAVTPWVLDNPLMLHVVSNDDADIRTAIDQASECGFEMVIMSFGSGLNMEDTSPANISRWKALREYATQKNVRFGGYSLLASRRISDEHDVINPVTGKTGGSIFGNSPCLGSVWGQEYFEKLKLFIEATGFQLLEHDGNYPGDQCASTSHPGHAGLLDSQWSQFQQITEFYKWCRDRDVFLNVPDYYQFNGSNKTGMGYRETNWSLPREQQHVHARQNMFDGTWKKTPSMGWMFVPLVQYHGGGAAATIEPLKEHLADYEMHFANTLGYGAQACWRGTRLYDSPETKAVVVKMVSWYKANRELLEADVIHLRRPDGRGLDYILHVLPGADPEAMLVVYNPTGQAITESIPLTMRAYGFSGQVYRAHAGGGAVPMEGDQVEVTVAARSWTWVKFSNKRA